MKADRRHNCIVRHTHAHKHTHTHVSTLILLTSAACSCVHTLGENQQAHSAQSEEIKFWSWDAPVQEQWFIDTHYTFIANEDKPFHALPLPGNIAYVLTVSSHHSVHQYYAKHTLTPRFHTIQVRRPFDRLASHFYHSLRAGDIPANTALYDVMSMRPRLWFTSNMYVKNLTGRKARAATPEDLRSAIATLDFFSCVLLTDSTEAFE